MVLKYQVDTARLMAVGIHLIGVLVAMGCSNDDKGNDATTDSDTGTDTEIDAGAFGDLREAAVASGKFLGTAVDATLLATNETYAKILTEEFDYITPEDATKWAPLEPRDDEYDFDDADAIVDFAEGKGQVIKGHTLVWQEQTPSWVNNSMSAEALETALKSHIETTIERYKGRIRAWDVVNEAVDASSASGYMENIFYDKLGPSYIADAFRWAREADSEALLFYNEVGIERLCAKSDLTYALMQALLAEDVPIDGIGFQSHVSIHRYPPLSNLRENIRRFADLGLIVNISEMDARTNFMPGSEALRLETQRIAFQQVVGACIVEPGCEGVTIWGIGDAYSWLNDEGQPDDPLIFDRSLAPKPAYYGVLDGLRGKLPKEGENQLQNGDFGNGADNWTATGGALSVNDAEGRESAAACITERGDAGDGLLQENLLSKLENGGPYSFTAWLRLSGNDAPETVDAELMVTEEGADAEARNIASRPIDAGKWMELSGYFGLGYDNTPEAISLKISGPAAGVELCVTDISITPLTPE